MFGTVTFIDTVATDICVCYGYMCFVCTIFPSVRGFAMGQVNTVLSLPTSEVQVIRSCIKI